VLPLWQTDLNQDSIELVAELMVTYGITDDEADVDELIADL
jgi:hypothetical protein